MNREPVIIRGHEIAGRMPLFKPELRQANRDRRKTMTRRVIGEQPNGEVTKCFHVEGQTWAMYIAEKEVARTLTFKCRYKVGDIRVMCEPLECGDDGRAWYSDTNEPVLVNGTIQWRWKRNLLTSVHMPYEAGRSLFRISKIWAERLRDITPEDAKAEGVRIPTSKEGNFLLDVSSKYAACEYINEETLPAFAYGKGAAECEQDLLRAYFAALWDSINAALKRAHKNPYTGIPEECYVSYPWEDMREIRERSGLKWYVIGNPYVWVIGYEAIE